MSEIPENWKSWPPGAKAELLWRLKARDKQTPPEGEWDVWLILAGRGFGKTKTGAEWLLSKMRRAPKSRWAVVGPTFGDVRDTCFEGESGIMSCAPDVKNFNRSLNELTLTNGAMAKGFGAEAPERLRGPQHHGAWIDELGSMPDPEIWHQLRFGLRLGEHPQICITTTPRPTQLIKDLAARAKGLPDPVDRKSLAEKLVVKMTIGHTRENADNLAPSALQGLLGQYEGTKMGRQELSAEILEDMDGALWSSEGIDADRVRPANDDEMRKLLNRLTRIVIAVDPAVTTGEDSDETGIIVAGVTAGQRPHGYVLADLSGKFTPDQWAERVVANFGTWKADRIIGETNIGGDLVESTLRNASKNIPYRSVHASRGKRIRAEPVSALYEQHRVHHVGSFDKLEDQMTSWVPDRVTIPHDDRLDALVYAIWELMVVSRPQFLGAA